MSLKVTVLIPAYNEEKTIIELLTRVNAQKISGVEFEILVVDDGSTDQTPQSLAAHPHLYTKVVNTPRNMGKGGAVRWGLGHATGDYVLFQDSDLEYDPTDYERLLVPVLKHNADVVMGSRLTAPPYTRVAYFWHKVGNMLITLTFNLINNKTFTDIYSCYLLYRRNLIDAPELKLTGWGQHAEILSLAVSRSRVHYEVPISYHGRSYDEGKKIRAYHVIEVIYAILRFGLFPTKRGSGSAS